MPSPRMLMFSSRSYYINVDSEKKTMESEILGINGIRVRGPRGAFPDEKIETLSLTSIDKMDGKGNLGV